jgi:hypothetical protein
MAFIAEQRHSMSRLPYACAEETQRLAPWIPAPLFCEFPQLAPQRIDEERSSHSTTFSCLFLKADSLPLCRVFNLL